MKMACRPYQRLSFSEALRGQALCVSGTLTAREGRAGLLLLVLPRLSAVGNFAVSKNLCHGFLAQALNMDTFSF